MKTRFRIAASLIAATATAIALTGGALAHAHHSGGYGGHNPNGHRGHGTSGYGGYGEGPEPPHHGRHLKLVVSAAGEIGAPCTQKKPCKKIAEALALAKPGATITVLAGEYPEEVIITERLNLIGVGTPTIKAVGLHNGVRFEGPATAGSLLENFTVKGANFEGVLAASTSGVSIVHNEVRENDRGNKLPTPEGECAPEGAVPGDCGEGIHLLGTSHSRVIENLVIGNAGGILLTDETGPTAHNLIAHNAAIANIEDCGITLAGHSPDAVSSMGKPQPAKAGIYDNKIVDNISNQNGLIGGHGAGILLASPLPGGGVYDNLIRGNAANDNGLPGITVHSHAPGQDLNGNKFIANQVSLNGAVGNMGTPGDEDTKLRKTAGIEIASAVTKLEGIVVKHNTISQQQVGIFTENVPPIPLGANTFKEVEIPLEQL